MEREAYRLERELMSPFCPGRTLADCPSPDAAELRRRIRSDLEAGVPPEDIVQEVQLRFGEAVRGKPEERWPWIVPYAVAVAGAIVLVVVLRLLARRSAGEGEAGEASPTPSGGSGTADELEAELDREIAG